MILNQPVTIEELTLGSAGSPTLQGNSSRYLVQFAPEPRVDYRQWAAKRLGRSNNLGNSNLYGWHLTLAGHTLWSGRLSVGSGVIDNMPRAVIDLSPGAIVCFYYSGGTRILNNYGTINAHSSSGITLDVSLNNSGILNVNLGSLLISNGGVSSGAINLANGTTLDFEDTNLRTNTNYEFSPTSSISGAGSVKFNSPYNYNIRGVYSITEPRLLTVGPLILFRRLLISAR